MSQSKENISELIHSHSVGLLEEVKDHKIKEDISRFFDKEVHAYLNALNEFTLLMSENNEYPSSMETKFTNLNNQILLKGFCLETLIENKVIATKIKEIFRTLVGTWAYQSPIVKRAFEKPRGYPGDYMMLEIVYNNSPLAKNGIALSFDRYFLSNPYAVAVRFRKDKLKEILQSEIIRAGNKPLHIFDIACGSCRELKEIPREIIKDRVITFSCLDWDEEALNFSRDSLKDYPGGIRFDFIKEDIMNLIKHAASCPRFAPQDIVYSIGLIDYLPDRVLKMFIHYFYNLLGKGGKFILTHKNKEKTFSPLPPDWFCDWKFVPRSKEEVVHLFYSCGIEEFSLKTEVDDFNDIFYFTIVKH